MQTNSELNLLAKRFIRRLKLHLENAQNDFDMKVSLTIPMSQNDFGKTCEILALVQTLGKEEGINIELTDESEAIKKYGHKYCFNFSKI